jgi:hypothetical protein
MGPAVFFLELDRLVSVRMGKGANAAGFGAFLSRNCYQGELAVDSQRAKFIVELTTGQGRVSERYETYVEACQRVEQLPAEELVGLAFIFQELPDGSERLLRQDGKPLQFHRGLVEDARECADSPLPLVEDPSSILGPEAKLRFVEPPGNGWDELGEELPDESKQSERLAETDGDPVSFHSIPPSQPRCDEMRPIATKRDALRQKAT